MKIQYTKGEWVLSNSKEEMEANAKLIAAAPYLLKTLNRIRLLAIGSVKDETELREEIIYKTEQAIKKATE